MNDEDLDDLAANYVTEYLEQTPEYIDVAEFIEENAPGDEEEISDSDVKAVFDRVVKLIQKVSNDYEAQR